MRPWARGWSTGLLREVGLPPALAERVELVGDGQPYATPFPVVECAASVLGSIGAAASLLWEERTGEAQPVTVDRGHAGASLVGFQLQRLEGSDLPAAPMSRERPLVKLYRCRDGRFIHLQGQFAHLAARTCAVLGCDVASGTDVVAERVARWDAPALEDALADAGTCGAMARTVAEWSAHPQAAAIAPWGRVSVEKIGESAPEVPRGAGRPLDGVRVLDLSRLLAGPTNARTLAEHGAEVLLVNSARLENIPLFVMDTSHGKRSCCLELDDPGGRGSPARAGPRGRRVHPGLSRRLAGPPGLRARGAGGNAAGHRGGDHQLLRRRWSVAPPSGLGADGPDRLGDGDRPGHHRSSRAGPRRGLRLHDRVPRRPGHNGSPVAPGPRGGQLSRARLAVSDRPLVHRGTGRARRVDRLRRPRPVPGDQRHALRAPAPPRARRPTCPLTPPRWEVPTSPIGTHAPAWQEATARI